jgi:hypothetical protein
MGRGRLGILAAQVLYKLINAHLSMPLGVSRSYVDGAFCHFLLSSNQNVVPLSELRISHFLINLALGAVDRSVKALLMKVLVN